MSSTETVRDAAERVQDALERLDGDSDVWVATAASGEPWLVPLSFHWTGEVLLMATLRRSRTYRNLAGGGTARLALGHTRDVVMIDGSADLPEGLPEHEADAVATASGYDPRTQPETAYVRFRPVRVQAWRTAEELAGRTVMVDGRWTAEPRTSSGAGDEA